MGEENFITGEQKAWEILAALNPEDVCKRTLVSFDNATGQYVVVTFGMDFFVSPKEKIISSQSPRGDLLLNKLAYFFRLSILWYLVSAKRMPSSERLVKPVNIKGGEAFFRGTHVLPLDKVAQKFANDKEGFVKKGEGFGGTVLDYADASVKLFPFPRIPVVLRLWLEDEEFPARADLLFDSTCELHLPLDILWSIAMMSLLLMLF